MDVVNLREHHLTPGLSAIQLDSTSTCEATRKGRREATEAR